jgi:hypothetical protein
LIPSEKPLYLIGKYDGEHLCSQLSGDRVKEETKRVGRGRGREGEEREEKEEKGRGKRKRQFYLWSP